MSWIQTYSGDAFDFLQLDTKSVHLRDIAHALSNLCRFNGHTRRFYSVAEHSVWVSQKCDPDYALQGLLHDATEAYVGDMVSPLKRLITDFSKHEANVWKLICKKFHVEEELHPSVKDADIRMLVTEKALLHAESPREWHPDLERISPYPDINLGLEPTVAEQLFRNRARQLGLV